MKRFVKIVILSGVLLLVFAFSFSVSLAAYTYTPMEKIPGFTTTSDFPTYLSNIYKFAVWTVGIAALLMLSIGGFMYLTSAGNNARMEKAKGVITDSVFGVVMVMTAYLLLSVINPDLVGGDLSSFKSPTVTVPPPVPTPPLGANVPQQILNNISLASSGSCKDANGNSVTPDSNINEMIAGKPMTVCNATCVSSNTPCTGQANLSNNIMQAMIKVDDKGFNKYIVNSIAGGQHTSEGSLHYKGKAIDIIIPSVPKSGWQTYVDEFNKNGVYARCEDNDGKTVACDPFATHLHVSSG